MATTPSDSHRRPPRSGNLRSRGRGLWELRLSLPPDPATGRRRQRSVTFHGNRRAAAAELRRLAADTRLEPAGRATNLRLTTLLDVWWEPKKPTLAATTAREYQRVIDTRLEPDLGAAHLDRLLPRSDQWIRASWGGGGPRRKSERRRSSSVGRAEEAGRESRATAAASSNAPTITAANKIGRLFAAPWSGRLDTCV